jgi:hypothetical protein
VVAVASVVLVILVGLTVVTRPHVRASARAGLASCMRGHWSARSGDSLHRTGHLARCMTRLAPLGTGGRSWVLGSIAGR